MTVEPWVFWVGVAVAVAAVWAWVLWPKYRLPKKTLKRSEGPPGLMVDHAPPPEPEKVDTSWRVGSFCMACDERIEFPWRLRVMMERIPIQCCPYCGHYVMDDGKCRPELELWAWRRRQDGSEQRKPPSVPAHLKEGA